MKIRILLFTSYYLPGYKAGGPIKTINNMVEGLSDDFEFWIVTRDRDLGDKSSYANLKQNDWLDDGRSKVIYLSPDKLNIRDLSALINNSSFDALYLNSFFDSKLSIKILLARKWRLCSYLPVVLAPRGEFSKGALSIKSWKKSVYISMAKLFGLYSEVLWQASTEHEKLDIQTKMNINESNIWLAKDLPEHISLSNIQNTPEQASSSILNILFLSRISPMKNLDFALKVLSKVKRDVRFDIYGPKEDLQYWLKCEALMDKLPMNVQAHYLGVVEPDRVAPTFANYDLFLFPTRGENYGHVIAESLAVGTPVLLSDQTPWKRLGEDGLGWDISLDSQGDFVDVIESFPLLGLDGRQNYREDVRESAMKRIHNSQDITDNKELFHSAIRLLG